MSIILSAGPMVVVYRPSAFDSLYDHAIALRAFTTSFAEVEGILLKESLRWKCSPDR